MKKNILLIAFLFICSATSQVLGQWTSQTISVSNLYDIFFTTPQNGYIASQGTIYKTIDGGNTWNPTTFTGTSAILMTNSTYLSLYFISPSTGFAAGYCAGNQRRIIIKSTDAGATWSIVENNGTSGTVLFRKIVFTSVTNGFAVGDLCSFRSTDGGNTWFSMTVPYTNSNEYRDIAFADASTGFILGDGENFETINGGSTWTLSSTLTGGFNTIDFYNGNTGYAAGTSGKVFKTTDTGVSWNLSPTYLTQAFNAGAILNTDTAYLGGDGVIAITRTGGNYWETQTYGSSLRINGMFFLSQDSGFAVCDSGVVLKTINGGGPSAPVASFTYQNAVYCTGDSIFFHAYCPPNYTYQWLINGSFFGGNQDAGFYFTSSGTYNIQLIVDNGFFTDTAAASVNVSLNTLDTNITFSYNNDTLCWIAAFQLIIPNSQGGVTYSLLRNDTLTGTSQAGTGLSITLYSGALNYPCTITLRASNNCGNYIIGQPISVFVYQFPDTSLQVTLLDSLLCRGHEFTAQVQIDSSQAGYTYSLWGSQFYGSAVSPGGTFTFLSDTITRPEMLAVKVTANYGWCGYVFLDSVFVDYDSLYSKFTTTDQQVKLNDTTYFLSNSTNASNLDWTFGAGANLSNYNGIATPPIAYSSTGNKQVELIATSAKGCVDTAFKNIRVYDNSDLINPDCWYNIMTSSIPHDIISDGENIYVSVNNQISFPDYCTVLSNLTGDTVHLPGLAAPNSHWTENACVIKFNKEGAFTGLFHGEFAPQAQLNINKRTKDIFPNWYSNSGTHPVFYSANGIDTLSSPYIGGGAFWMLRYDYTGHIKWVDFGWGSAFDASNNIYYFPGYGGTNELRKVDESGNLIWSLPYPAGTQRYFLENDSAGTSIFHLVYQSGVRIYKTDTAGFTTDSVMLQLLPGGNFNPNSTAASLKYYENSLYLMGWLSNGGLVFGNDTITPNPITGALVILKFDSNLNPIWGRKFTYLPGGGIWNNADLRFYGNDLYFTGYFMSQLTFENSVIDTNSGIYAKRFVIGLDTAGAFSSYFNVRSSGSFGYAYTGIDFDNNGKAYFLCQSYSDIIIGNDTILNPVVSSGIASFLIKFDEMAAPIINANGPVTFCLGGSVTLSVNGAFNSYYWSNGSTASTITVNSSGAYYVIATGSSGCKVVSKAIIVTALNCTDISEQSKNIFDVTIVPNPFNSKIDISVNKQNLKQVSLTIKNILGQNIFNKQENILNGNYTKTIDLNFLSKGIYLLDVIIDGERTVKKIVKE
ncbi:MAG: YCF48-related protein [Bacteroidia bacterium]